MTEVCATSWDAASDKYYSAIMTLIARQVEQWYSEHSRELAKRTTTQWVCYHEPDDPVRGKAAVGIETPKLLVSITFWNKGEAEVIEMHKSSGKETIPVDRRLAPGETVESLLDLYCGPIINYEK